MESNCEEVHVDQGIPLVKNLGNKNDYFQSQLGLLIKIHFKIGNLFTLKFVIGLPHTFLIPVPSPLGNSDKEIFNGLEKGVDVT